MRRRERKGVAAKTTAAPAVDRTVKQEPKAVKSDPRAALSKAFASAKPKSEVKEEAKPEIAPAESGKPAPGAENKKPTPALKRGGSNTSSIMQAFSKAATKVKRAETSQPATPSGDDSSAQPMSDDGEDDSEMPQPVPRGAASRKTRKEREEELRRMMDADDDEDDEDEDDASEKRAESPVEEPMDETADEPEAPEPAPAEPAEVVTTSTDGRRRGKRKVMRKKQVMDEQGYLGAISTLLSFQDFPGVFILTHVIVTIQEPGWESFSEDEAPPATRPKTSSAASSAPASQTAKTKKGGAKGSQGTQGSIMSFFSKK